MPQTKRRVGRPRKTEVPLPEFARTAIPPYDPSLTEKLLDMQDKLEKLDAMKRAASREFQIAKAYKRRFQIAGMAVTSLFLVMLATLLLKNSL